MPFFEPEKKKRTKAQKESEGGGNNSSMIQMSLWDLQKELGCSIEAMDNLRGDIEHSIQELTEAVRELTDVLKNYRSS